MAKNYDDYVKAIKLQSDHEKSGEYGSFLLKPSPAQLRNLCLIAYDKPLSKKDNEQFRNFFQAKENEDLRKCILNVDVERLKPLRFFFTGKSETTNLTNLELIAVLVNFPQRPLRVFLKEEYSGPKTILEQGIIVIEEKSGETTSELLVEQPSNIIQDSKRSTKNKYLLVVLGIVCFLSVSYVAKDTYFPEKECMQWQENHYEIVDCGVKGIMDISPVIALDESVINLKRVPLKKNMKPFKYGKPLYYYHKLDNNVEFFDGPGEHPVTKKDLKPITWHMFHRYAE